MENSSVAAMTVWAGGLGVWPKTLHRREDAGPNQEGDSSPGWPP